LATKTPRHKETQSNEYQLNKLGESFVTWCLCGKKKAILADYVAEKAFWSRLNIKL
jgi:hypothetical protein